ncbi:hypothetical protein LOC54_10880 [Acetobacter sp. AN02]|uniref:hypothetical protein n=1 Tax=Acetobacter sp. AN02 TaxID=2894186 RepID=UPI0024342DFA|nr:hypothetical protein [Acetobacter sp. AN02]MDG6095594.1 hypothetical protein [Acetobacter sp. AN02]
MYLNDTCAADQPEGSRMLHPLPRTPAQRSADTLNIKDYGAILGDSSGASDIKIIDLLMGNNISKSGRSIQSRILEIPAGRWPHYTIIPKNTADTDFVRVLGRLEMYPYFPVTAHDINMAVPYFGDGVLSETHATMGGGNLEFARVDSNNTNAREYRPAVSFTLVGDTPEEKGNRAIFGQKNVVFNQFTTERNNGNSQNVHERAYYMGLNGAGEFDVNHWNDVQIEGTNWVWANLVTMNEGISFSDGNGPVSPSWLYEEDMSGFGPDTRESAHDPFGSKRKMYWMTTNHNENNDDNSNRDLSWAPDTKFPAGRIIIRTGRAGPVMYRNISGGAVSGKTMPVFPLSFGAQVKDGGITWQNIGIETYDIGCLICIAGGSDARHHERIGTIMAETTDLIYNAVFDFSQAKFDQSVERNIFARLHSDMYLDMTADGTQNGQNNHILGYNSARSSLEYEVRKKPVLEIKDDGTTVISGSLSGADGTVRLSSGLVLAPKTKSEILAVRHPSEPMTYYDTTDHAEVTYRCPGGGSCGWFPVRYGAPLKP